MQQHPDAARAAAAQTPYHHGNGISMAMRALASAQQERYLWAARKVQAERAGAGDVWPAGWTHEQIAAHRAIGERAIRLASDGICLV